LDDKDDTVRFRAIEQLGKNKFNPALNYIKKASRDKNPLVRQAACLALGRIGSEEDAVLLNARLYDPDIYVRAAAKAAVSSLASAPKDFAKKKKPKVAAKSKFLELLWQDTKSQNPAARASSYIALANLGDTKIVPLALKELVASDSPTLMRREAARALVILKPRLAEVVRRSLSGSKDGNILSENLQTYYSVKGKNLLSVFIDALRDDKSPLHKDAPSVLKELKEDTSYPFLREALFDTDAEFQAKVVYALGDLRDKEALPYIIKLCKQYGF
jgi:HEAT repeat protein